MLVEQCAFTHLNYCRDIWGDLSHEHKEMLQKLQNFGAKIIFKKQKFDHASPLVAELNWLSVENTSKYFLACTIYKTINNIYNPNVTKIFNFNYHNTSEITTRFRSNPTIPLSNSSYGDKSILNRATKLWIRFPETITNANSLSIFTKNLKQHISIA